MSLFDASTIDPTFDEALRWEDSDFAYLSKSARPSIGRVRALLNDLFDTYPLDHQAEIMRRIKSSPDLNSPFFELALYRFISGVGANVKVYPETTGPRNNRPDFLVQLPSSIEYYVEASLVTGMSKGVAAEERKLHAFYDAINRKLKSPGFVLTISVSKIGPDSANAKKLIYDASKYIAALDRKTLQASMANGSRMRRDRFIWKDAGWVVDLSPFPISNETDTTKFAPLGAYIGPFIQPMTADDIRRKIDAKLDQHTYLDHPYIIALNVTHPGARLDHVYGAIRGTVVTRILNRAAGGEDLVHYRENDGIWSDRGPSKAEGLAGVLVVMNLTPFSVADQKLVFFSNPARQFRDPHFRSFAGVRRNGARITVTGGTSFGAILGVEPGWPGGD